MIQLTLRCALSAAVVLAWTPSPLLAQAQTTAPDPRSDRPHRVYVPAQDTAELAALRGSGRVLQEVDYGGFRLVLVADGPDTSVEDLARAGYEVREDEDLILFDGLALDGRAPETALATLEPGERFGTARPTGLDSGAGLYVVQFIGPIKDTWLEDLAALGVEPIQYIPWNAYVVKAGGDRVSALQLHGESRREVQYIGNYEPAFRLTPGLRRASREAVGTPLAVTLQFLNGAGVRDALAELEPLALAVERAWAVGPYVNVEALVDPVYLPWLATRTRVFGIAERGQRVRRSTPGTDERQGQTSAGNISGNAPSGPGYLAWLASHGFDASQFGSFSVNVVDDAYSLTGHPDLPNGRITFSLNPSNQTGTQGGHGFLNAHIVAGFNDGTGSAAEDASGYNYGLGIAPWARVGSTAIFGPGGTNPLTYESQAYAQGARISTNSWSFIDGSQNPIPDYDANSQAYDVLTRDAQSGTAGNQEYLILFSAGNDATANTVSTPSTAKNILTVGASENNRQTGTDGCGVPNSGANSINDLASFSSEGPVDAAGGDGRWKPEIVAPGTHVQAGVPQSNFNGSSVCDGFFPAGQTLYGWSSGTSHSTPGVAGGSALVYQWFLNEGMGAPSPAMNKAVLCGTAEYMTGSEANDTLPSNRQGMGRMQLERAFDSTSRLYVDQTELLSSTGASYVLAGTVADPAKPLRIVLAWTDAPGATTGAPWVNDLDLEVDLGGQTYFGNVFAGAFSATGGSADVRNNVESAFFPAGTTGAFTLTVQASQIAGDGVPGNGDGTDQDFALFVYNGTIASGPLANFTAAPAAGIVPLTVSFTDNSVGTVTSRSWTFGDGGTSTQQNPTHIYTAPGTYDVSLTVTGPDGSDTRTQLALIDVQSPPPPGVSDGSFESQAASVPPTTPWSTTGTGHVVHPTGAASDSGLPTDGTQWAALSAASSDGGTPPSNPGGVTAPPVGGAGIEQTFTYPAGQPQLLFEAAFLRNENSNQSQFNDWMSVDVSDGSTTVNVYYADTFTPTVGTSSEYGFAVTAVSSVTADLAALFPGSTPTTLFTLTAQVGNGFDALQPSVGYVDHFRFDGPGLAPLAAFSGAPTSGALPLAVSFTDASTGTVSAWSWTFGDGGTSTLQNPSHTYTAAGTYTVALTATGPGGSDAETKVDYVVVAQPAPVADFSGAPTSGVAPLSVAFTDASSGAVTAWSWTFGDGATSALQNPSHTYSGAGTYTVALTATGPGGSDAETKVDYIVVAEPAPVADFSGAPTSGVAPLSVAFTDASTGAVTAWAWTFGDGATSALQNPSHTYAGAGTYTVALTATGPGGSDLETKLDYIVVAESAPVADFSGAPTSGVAPLSVAFTDASSGAVTAWAWTFGDGATSALQNPSHTYSGAGTYTVALTATGPGGSDAETKVDYIVVAEPAPVADFSGTPTSGVAPLSVAFTDASVGAVTAWAWTFGDGATSALQNPSHTYSGAGTYTVALTATGPGGSDLETKLDYIVVAEPAPIANFSGTPTSGVAPLSVAFTDASSGAVTAWSWTFGDGATSALQNPSHTYAGAGTYTVALTATGPGGSDVETKVDYVVVAEPAPVADFSGAPTSGVAPLSVAFSDASTGAVTAWSWTFGDGATSALQNPSHTYAGAGTYTVALTTTGPGGSNLETKLDYVVVAEPAPVADFSGAPTSGVAPLSVAFTDASVGAVTAWSWTFGDGATSALQNPSHTYAGAGTYTVALTATGPGGSDLETKLDYVVVAEPAPVAEFSGAPTSGVAPLTVAFTDASSGAVTAWSWTFGDGATSALQNPSHTYAGAGTYTVALTATGPGGSDLETKLDYVVVAEPAPVAEFSGAPTSGVAPLSVAFTDASVGAVTAWAWTFGDGATSALQNPSHTYSGAGTYTVALTATGPGGSDAETKVDYIVVAEPAPVADFSGTPTSGVAPLSVAFTDASVGAVTAWAWTFGDGATSALQNPSHTYAGAGTYTVALTATGPGGSDAETKLDYVVVAEPAPVADFSGAPTSGVAPLSVAFTDASTGAVTAWSWTFGDGATSALQNPSHTYAAAGTYTVALTATGPGGTDGETKAGYVVVAEPAPTADFDATPTSGRAPLPVSFNDLSSGAITSWAWDFGDGATSNLPSPDHVYAEQGTYTVTLAVSGPGGLDSEIRPGLVQVRRRKTDLTATPVVTVTPEEKADFFSPDRSGSAPHVARFTNTSLGEWNRYEWDFGDGTISRERHPTHVYATPGTYAVTLEARREFGAVVDTATRPGYILVTAGLAAAPAPLSTRDVPPSGGTLVLRAGSVNAGTRAFLDGELLDAGQLEVLDAEHVRVRLPAFGDLQERVLRLRTGDVDELHRLRPAPAEAPRIRVRQLGNGRFEILISGEPGSIQTILMSGSPAPSRAGTTHLDLGDGFRDLVSGGTYRIPEAGSLRFLRQGSDLPSTVYAQTATRSPGGRVLLSKRVAVNTAASVQDTPR